MRKRPLKSISVPRVDSALFPLPSGTRCISIVVPDADEYVRLLAGLYSIAIAPSFWGGADYGDNGAHAALILAAFTETNWEGCMDCSGVAGCIDGDAGVQAALAGWLASQQIFSPGTPGLPVPGYLRAANLVATDAECDNDAAWGNIRSGIIDRAMQAVVDILEQIELTTDNQDMLVSIINVIPIASAAGVSGFIAWFDNVRAFLHDAFVAGDTTEKRDAMACDLFCIWQQDCSLSFDDIASYFYDKAESHFPSYENAFTDAYSLLLAFANPTELTGEFVVDVLLAGLFGFVSFVNGFFGVTLKTLMTNALLGERSDDWILLCAECAELPDNYRVFNYEGGATQASGRYTNGVPFDVVAYNVGGVWVLDFVIIAPGDYIISSSFAPSPVAGATGNDWAYTDTSDVLQTGAYPPDTPDTLPSPATMRFSGNNDAASLALGGGESFVATLTVEDA